MSFSLYRCKWYILNMKRDKSFHDRLMMAADRITIGFWYPFEPMYHSCSLYLAGILLVCYLFSHKAKEHHNQMGEIIQRIPFSNVTKVILRNSIAFKLLNAAHLYYTIPSFISIMHDTWSSAAQNILQGYCIKRRDNRYEWRKWIGSRMQCILIAVPTFLYHLLIL